jgi:hypothetical protein
MNSSNVSLKMDQYRWIPVELCIVLYEIRILSFAFLYQTVKRGEGIKYFINSSKVSLKMDQYRWNTVVLCNVWYVLRILNFAFLYQTVRPGEAIEFFIKSSIVSLKWINIDESLWSFVACDSYSKYLVSPSCI